VPAPAANYARLCIPFVVATALRRGGVDVPDFAADRLADLATHDLATRVTVVVDDNPDQNALMPQRVQVTLRSGARHEMRLPSTFGHPDCPLTRDQHLAKFRRCWTYGAKPLDPERGERLVELVDELPRLGDVRELVALTMP